MLTSCVILKDTPLEHKKCIYRYFQSVFVFTCASVEHHEFGERVGPVLAGVVPAGSGRGSVLMRAS